MNTRTDSIRSRHALACSIAIALGLFASLTVTSLAFARVGGCRSDPKVYLTDGTKITLTADIGADKQDVLLVNYVVHVPTGARVDRVVYTAGRLGHHESLQVVADNPTGTYDSDTVVTTRTHGVAVTATATALNQVSGVIIGSGSASGYDQDDLHVHLPK